MWGRLMFGLACSGAIPTCKQDTLAQRDAVRGGRSCGCGEDVSVLKLVRLMMVCPGERLKRSQGGEHCC